MSIFNIKSFNDNVGHNIKLIIKTFGKKFIIKINDFNIPIIIKKIKTDIPYYVIKYDMPKRTYDLLPFKIAFIDICNRTINNNAYIQNIHKTDEISGTKMMECVLLILKELHVPIKYIFMMAQQ